MKKKNGITLIALVITIIVLLILAGVSISTIMGENGIIGKATTAKEKTEKSQIKENILLEISKIQLENGNKVLENDLNYILEKYGSVNDIEGKKILKTDEGLEIDVTDIFANAEKIEPVEASELEIGDYISNYPVTYTNVGSIGEEEIPSNNYNGWRVLAKKFDEDGNMYIQLISAGIPLNYIHKYGSEDSAINTVNALTTNFLKTEINTNIAESGKFFKCGFDIGTNTNLENIFINDVTQNVSSVTLDDIYTLLGENTYSEFINSSTYADLIKIPTINGDSTASWWIATSYESAEWIAMINNNNNNNKFEFVNVPENSKENENFDNLIHLTFSDEKVNEFEFLGSAIYMPYSYEMIYYYTNKYDITVPLSTAENEFGIRPVITLKSNIQFLPAEEINSTTAWQIVY